MLSGILGVALLGGSIATMTVSRAQHEQLRQRFSGELADRYDQIVRERRNLYLQGLALGGLLALGTSQWMTFDSAFHRVSFFVAVMLLVTIVYYSVMPKSDYMLRHLKSAEENAAWLEMYTTMKQRYTWGALLGALAAIPLGYAWCARRPDLTSSVQNGYYY